MELELSGNAYSVRKIDAMAQFHIVRKLLPTLGDLVPAFKDLAPMIKKAGIDKKLPTVEEIVDDEDMFDVAMNALPLMARAVASLSKEDADSVIFGLLAAVSRKDAGGVSWSPVKTPGANMLQYADLEMFDVLRLSWEALRFNLKSFFSVLQLVLKEAAPKESTGQ